MIDAGVTSSFNIPLKAITARSMRLLRSANAADVLVDTEFFLTTFVFFLRMLDYFEEDLGREFIDMDREFDCFVEYFSVASF